MHISYPYYLSSLAEHPTILFGVKTHKGQIGIGPNPSSTLPNSNILDPRSKNSSEFTPLHVNKNI